MTIATSKDIQGDIYVDQYTVVCAGPGGDLGHPHVALSLEKGETVVCPYCNQRFVRRLKGTASGHGI